MVDLIVDASMVYAANNAKLAHLKRSDGYSTGAVFGTIRMIESAINDTDADRVFFVVEGGGTARKRELFPEYKSGREASTAAQMSRGHVEDIFMWARLRGIALAHCRGYEADDVVYEIWRQARLEGNDVFILSKDHDFRACLDEGTSLWWGKTRYTRDHFFSEFGFDPMFYPSFLVLAGDGTDSVPGLVSRKDALEHAVTGTLGILMDEQPEEDVERNMRLITMGTGLDTVLVMRHPMDRDALTEFFIVQEMRTLERKVPELKELGQ